MSFQAQPGTIKWKLHFASSCEAVFDALATDTGRALFWAESAPECDGRITSISSITSRSRAACFAPKSRGCSEMHVAALLNVRVLTDDDQSNRYANHRSLARESGCEGGSGGSQDGKSGTRSLVLGQCAGNA